MLCVCREVCAQNKCLISNTDTCITHIYTHIYIYIHCIRTLHSSGDSTGQRITPTRGIKRPTSETLKKYLVGRPILLIFPLYCSHRRVTQRLVKISRGKKRDNRPVELWFLALKDKSLVGRAMFCSILKLSIDLICRYIVLYFAVPAN